MKRDKPSNFNKGIREIKPFFWKECRFCHKEFRKEKGFAIKGMTINGYVSETYCCSNCCKNIDEVEEKLDDIKAPESAFAIPTSTKGEPQFNLPEGEPPEDPPAQPECNCNRSVAPGLRAMNCLRRR